MSFLHQIFYPYNKFDSKSSLKELEPFMLSKMTKNKLQSIKQVISLFEIKPTESIETVMPIQQNKEIIYSTKENSLFWSIFIAQYGYAEYLSIGQKYGNVELEEKQKIIEHFKKNPKQLKQINVKVTNLMIQEIMSELMIQRSSSFLSTIAMAIYYQFHIILVNVTNNTYLDFFPTTTDNDCKKIVIYRNADGKYGIDIDITDEKINSILEYFKVDQQDKPLKGISTYKMTELEDICKKLGIKPCEDVNTKYKKQDVYLKIWQFCLW
jgi:hypothetical protein